MSYEMSYERKLFLNRERTEYDTIPNLRIRFKDRLEQVKKFRDESSRETFQQTVDKFVKAGFKVKTEEFRGYAGALDDYFNPDEIQLTSRYGRLFSIYYFPDNGSGY